MDWQFVLLGAEVFRLWAEEPCAIIAVERRFNM